MRRQSRSVSSATRVTLEVMETELAMKGQTASVMSSTSSAKPARTGARATKALHITVRNVDRHSDRGRYSVENGRRTGTFRESGNQKSSARHAIAGKNRRSNMISLRQRRIIDNLHLQAQALWQERRRRLKDKLARMGRTLQDFSKMPEPQLRTSGHRPFGRASCSAPMKGPTTQGPGFLRRSWLFSRSEGFSSELFLDALAAAREVRQPSRYLLLSEGRIVEEVYYRALARHLGCPYYIAASPRLRWL